MSEPIRLSDKSMESVPLQQYARNQPARILQTNRDFYAQDDQYNDRDKNRLEQVDSEDVPSTDEMPTPNRHGNDPNPNSTSVPFYKHFLHRMNPNECMSPTFANVAQTSISVVHGCTTTAYKTCVASDREELDYVLGDILKDIRFKGGGNQKSIARTIALQRLYRLTDREHAHNRVPAVCTTSFATIAVLVTCLHSSVPVNDRRQALLVLNNLCIPIENKAAIIFGEPFEIFMNAILQLVRSRSTESYLALVALLNLSYIQDDHAKVAMYNFILKTSHEANNLEAPNQYGFQLPIDNAFSTIRILECLLQDYVPVVNKQRSVNSIELQCCRWTMNIVRNLVCTIPTHATAIGRQTKIPNLSIQFLVASDTSNLTTWTRDSLEDACLMVLIHICRFDECVYALKDNMMAVDDLISFCEKVKGKGDGIHQVRAKILMDRILLPVIQDDSQQSVGYSV